MATQLSFVAFLLLFVGVGFSSVLVRRKQSADYLLAGRSLPPSLAGLSAVATNNSGYMFIGVIGFTYTTGLAALWLMLGWIVGDFLISLRVHPKLREATDRSGALTYPALLGDWHGQGHRVVRVVAAALAAGFLGIYAAAQFDAGSKALHVLFGWPSELGKLIGATMVLFYCFSGGLRASVWTDAAQSVVMILGMAVMVWITVAEQGGVAGAVVALDEVSPTFLDLFPPDLAFGAAGPALFVIGWLFAGFAVVGQPQVMIRFMSLDEDVGLARTRVYYYLWFTSFYALATIVGLMARLILPELTDVNVAEDTELALPALANAMLPGVLAGLVLAGLFAATISTADSLILTCSAALSRDLAPAERRSYLATRAATLLVIVVALVVALWSQETVFALVLHAWSGLGAAFGPLLLLYSTGFRPSQGLAVAMMLVGAGGVFAWQAVPEAMQATLYEVVPGMAAGAAVLAAAWLVGGRRAVRRA
jgi:sodium/proline symporter